MQQDVPLLDWPPYKLPVEAIRFRKLGNQLINTILLILILVAVLIPDDRRAEMMKRLSGAFFICLIMIATGTVFILAIWNYYVANPPQYEVPQASSQDVPDPVPLSDSISGP